jgi:hypothetical protein
MWVIIPLKTLQNEHFREISEAGASRDTKAEILPAQPLVLHQEPPEPPEPQDPQGPQSEQHGGRPENVNVRACG